MFKQNNNFDLTDNLSNNSNLKGQLINIDNFFN